MDQISGNGLISHVGIGTTLNNQNLDVHPIVSKNHAVDRNPKRKEWGEIWMVGRMHIGFCERELLHKF